MKGFTRDHKFIPMTDYKKVRKSRDQRAKTIGVRLARENNNVVGKALEKLRKTSDFEISPDHTWGYTETKPRLPTYGIGVAFAQDTKDINEKTHRFGKEGRGNRAFTTELGEDRLKEVLEDAKKEHLIFEFATVRDLIIDSQIITSTEKDRPVILKLTERERERYYLIAPRVDQSQLQKAVMAQVVRENIEFEKAVQEGKVREKTEPFPVGKRRPEGLGDQDVIEALQGKKELTRADLIAMQRQPRKARVPPDATKKELIKMLNGRFTELTGGDFVPATNFDFKNFKKEQVGQILEGSVEIPQTYYAIRNHKSGLIELRQKRFKPEFKRGREHPHDVIALARDLPELESMIKTIEASP